MLRSSLSLIALMLVGAHAGVAQGTLSTPGTIAAAEVEGAAYPRGATPATTSSLFSKSFSGSEARQCEAPPSGREPAGGSLRSGDFIARTAFAGAGGFLAKSPKKMLWMPLHNPFTFPDSLFVRATKLGTPPDSVRFSVDDAVYQPGTNRVESGFVSEVVFPSGGQWMVIATAGTDWGCFLLHVAG